MDDLGGKTLFSETPISIESKLYILFTLSFNMEYSECYSTIIMILVAIIFL